MTASQYRDLQDSQSINFQGTRVWRLRVISLITFLILVILVLVIVVAVTNKNKDAKIAEVDTNMRRHGKNSKRKTNNNLNTFVENGEVLVQILKELFLVPTCRGLPKNCECLQYG